MIWGMGLGIAGVAVGALSFTAGCALIYGLGEALGLFGAFAMAGGGVALSQALLPRPAYKRLIQFCLYVVVPRSLA